MALPRSSLGRFSLVLGVCLASATASAKEPAPPPAIPSSDADAARALFDRAVELAEEGDWQEALLHYERSYAVKPAMETRYSIGVAQLHTGRLVAARESFRGYLRDTQPGPEADKFRVAAERALQVIDRRIGRVTLTAAQGEAIIRLDGSEVAPGELRLVDPGMHVAEVSAPGFSPQTRTLAIEEGERLELQLDLAPLQSPDASPDAAAYAPPYVPIGFLIAGGALLTVGVSLGVAGIDRADGAIRESPRADSGERMAIAGDVLATAGACATAVGLIWLLVDGGDGDHADTATGPTVKPWTSGEVAGLAVSF
jgi:hypothetical protein